MAAPSIARCVNHAERPAFARCMSCGKMLCQECATQWDGIWHCAECLAASRSANVQRSSAGAWFGVVTLSAIFLYLGARVMVWVSALIASMF